MYISIDVFTQHTVHTVTIIQMVIVIAEKNRAIAGILCQYPYSCEHNIL